jgi:integrase
MARGWLKVENRKQGKTWVLRFMTSRKSDGKRVEHKIPVGSVREFPSESSAWMEVQRQHLNVNTPDFRGAVKFSDLAEHYIENELGDQSESVDPKSHTTIGRYKSLLHARLIPRWGKQVALGIEPLEIEQWLKAVKKNEQLENPTVDKMRRVMSLVYKSGMRYGLIPRNEESNPLSFVRCKTTSEYEALILTPKQAFDLLMALPEPERTMALLVAATGLRISECLGLQWADVDFAKQQVFVRRKWVNSRIGVPKSKASKAPVPMHPLLAGFMDDWKRETPYAQPEDWVFASTRKKGKQPRTANVMVADYIRPAAAKVGILSSHRGDKGELVEDDPRRFGFHNLRHSLATFLVSVGTNPKVVQGLLRHSDVHTTLQLYTQSVSADRLAAQGTMLDAMGVRPELVN